ncbi:MAG TPA: tetratricopeptide repeat protein [Allosphingosinicella sp.]|uniref:tetratricopeptide repeat protein n=1 Tax=Allosphingosinicella sp. TaxID=2823234 RepID=UPI002ED83097
MAGKEDRAALIAYAKARVAGSAGVSDEAARSYAAALALSPRNEVLATQAFAQALEAGNRVLAVNAARALEAAGQSSTDSQLVLLGEAFSTKNWKRASAYIGSIEMNQGLSFLGPVLRAWMAVGSKRGDPLASLAAAPNPLTQSYAAEHRPLLLLATRRKSGAEELLKLAGGENLRDQRLRIAGAATLARKGDRKTALRLLDGNAPALLRAREIVEARGGLPGDVSTPSAGVAELLIRLAGDLQRQGGTEIGLRFARIATFLAPENSETWLVTSDILTAAKQNDAALIALSQVPASDPFADTASSARIGLLASTGRSEKALAEAKAAAEARPSVTAYSALGDIYGDLDRHQEAAEAYGRALTLLKEDPDAQPEWTLHLLRGGSLEQAERWPEAKAALEAAYKLAPTQAVVLNYLGYAQLERRENIDAAMKLIAEAAKLQPDSAEITDSLGWAHFLTGDTAKAIELLERAAQGAAADPEINEHLGDAYFKVGRRYEARYAWKAALLYAEAKDAPRLQAKIDAGWTPELASR